MDVWTKLAPRDSVWKLGTCGVTAAFARESMKLVLGDDDLGRRNLPDLVAVRRGVISRQWGPALPAGARLDSMDLVRRTQLAALAFVTGLTTLLAARRRF